MKDTTKETFLSALRHVLTAVGSMAITHGYITQSQATELAGAIPLLVGGLWGPLDEYLSARRVEDDARNKAAIAAAVEAAVALALRTQASAASSLSSAPIIHPASP